MEVLERVLWYWGPTLLVAAAVLAVMRTAMSRQARYFKTQSDNATAQTAELSKIHRSLEQIVMALESRPSAQDLAGRNSQ
jgi:hypothetical protein